MAQAKPMTKAQIIEHLSKKTGTTKKLTSQFLEELVSLSYKEAKKSFVFPGLGKLAIVARKKRQGRNPATGEAITIPAKKVLKFRVAKAAKDAILGAKK
ncbi:MAG: HU family DNA-binding protein [Bacteroidota bacterium]|nr:HU family DNA-binding protein [Bacteroidota bacterium]MDP4190376.1 HU family DNA-binding protein [Bacteroidota bacterium]MDP4195315.1 HU family DNA-binding protein [Bacteroidota bacterium]